MNEYLLGSRKLKAFPVAMSLVASYVSGVTILGTPSEIYYYGTQYWLITVPIILMGFTVCYVFLPVFSSLRVGSSYEYLELRFSPQIRAIASIMFVIDEVSCTYPTRPYTRLISVLSALFSCYFYPSLSTCPHLPSLKVRKSTIGVKEPPIDKIWFLVSVTGVNLYMVAFVVCIVCVFYTIVGGIRAVVATDAWQVLVMFFSVVVIAVLGTYYLGGPSEVFRIAREGERLKFFV